ncbi:hypothetical protein BRARA_B01742 [Brassica rapa]|uniref:Uncharacterized protein n=2 Tax=Brassica TaxID=3705 RepID=A0A398AB04_BRACM|nr:hypothetical protein BRARA_B01742 [Brassica rapa]CAF2138735.1 unnamed protein product [Brassica napus]CAG7893013.1 unnamed protein product [Brassica rapa]CDY12668.1 BnaA02g13360D [Brassica napus]
MTNSTTCEENERMLCGHCGVKTPIRREGNSGTVKTCDWCGKVLADETGTVEEYNELFLRLQYFQKLVSKFKKKKRQRIRER